jgi:translocation and assembly module TamA
MKEKKIILLRWNAGKIIPLLFVLALFFYLETAEASVTAKVTVEGVEGKVLENVLKYLRIEQQKKDPDLTDGIIRRLHGRAEEDIRSALQPFGYYNPSVLGELRREDSSWHATYRIDPGEAVTVSDLDIRITGTGADDEGLKKSVGDFPIKMGDILVHARYEKGKRALLDLALNRGYLDAAYDASRVEVHPVNNSATILLLFATGPRYRFGEVSFKQDALRPEFIERFVRFKKGDLFSFSDLSRLQSDLRNSDYFSEVDVRHRRDLAEELEVPVEVTLVPRKRNAYAFGVGFGTDTGARASVGWENRRINRWGHKLGAILRVSEIKSNLTSRYTVPLANPSTDYRAYTVGLFEEDTKTYESDIFGAGLSLNHTYNRWRRTISINYVREDFTVASDSGQSDLIIPVASWTYVKADDRLYTTHGWRVLFEVKGAYEDLISDSTFIQLLLQPKFIYGVGGFGRFILRGEGGTTLVDDFSGLAASQRFFAGGDQSVRGYDYKTLGPTDENGDVTGGEHLLVGSIEYEQRIYKNWSAAIFYDVGNAIHKLSDPYKEGAGFGIRWLSPVGPIRVDLAFALSKPGDPLRLHLSIGPDL